MEPGATAAERPGAFSTPGVSGGASHRSGPTPQSRQGGSRPGPRGLPVGALGPDRVGLVGASDVCSAATGHGLKEELLGAALEAGEVDGPLFDRQTAQNRLRGILPSPEVAVD